MNSGIRVIRHLTWLPGRSMKLRDIKINKTSTIDSASVNPLKSSYSNYAQEIRKLWNGYEKPAIIGETGWAHTFYEPSMPGYLAQYHNALWVSLATGAQ